MKKVVVAFVRARYTSDPDGQVQAVPLPPALMEVLGGATSLRWEVTVYARSSTNARLDLTVVEGTKKDPRPSANKFSGSNLGSTPLTISALQITTLQINGPFHGLVDATLGAKSQTPSVGTMDWMDAEVRVTLEFE